MPALLLLLFVVVPILELAVIIKVGDLIGFWPTLAILIADSILGTVLMRSQGRLAWRRFNQAIAAGRPPAKEALDGVLVIVGGAFLLAPGFCTDLLGLALVLPPTRAIIRAALLRRLGKGMTARFMHTAAKRSTSRFGRPGPADTYDDDGPASGADWRRLS